MNANDRHTKDANDKELSDENLNQDQPSHVNQPDPLQAKTQAITEGETLVKTSKPKTEPDSTPAPTVTPSFIPAIPTPPDIVYSDLRDETTFATPVKPSALPASQPLSGPVLHNALAEPLSTERLTPTPTDTPTHTSYIPSQPASAFIGDGLGAHEHLVKTPKADAITDASILANSHQRVLGDPQKIADARGRLIEHMGVALKQWILTAEWQRTDISQSKFFGLKHSTQTVDLDLSCLLCNRYGEVLERVWFKNVRDQAEAVRYLGDELLGNTPSQPDPRLDDTLKADERKNLIPDHGSHQERMAILLPRIAPAVFQLVFVVSSYGDYALAQAQHGRCQLADDEGNEIATVDLTRLPDGCRALWLATLSRSADSWRFREENLPLKISKKVALEHAISEHLVRAAK